MPSNSHLSVSSMLLMKQYSEVLMRLLAEQTNSGGFLFSVPNVHNLFRLNM